MNRLFFCKWQVVRYNITKSNFLIFVWHSSGFNLSIVRNKSTNMRRQTVLNCHGNDKSIENQRERVGDLEFGIWN